MIFAHFISIEVISNVQDVLSSFVFCSTLLQANVLKVFAIPRFWRPFCPVNVNNNSESVSSPYLQPKLYPNFPSLGWKDCWRIWRVSVTLAFCLSSLNTNVWCEFLLGLNAFNGITRIINVVSFPKTALYRMGLGIWFRCIEISTIETGSDQAITSMTSLIHRNWKNSFKDWCQKIQENQLYLVMNGDQLLLYFILNVKKVFD